MGNIRRPIEGSMLLVVLFLGCAMSQTTYEVTYYHGGTGCTGDIHYVSASPSPSCNPSPCQPAQTVNSRVIRCEDTFPQSLPGAADGTKFFLRLDYTQGQCPVAALATVEVSRVGCYAEDSSTYVRLQCIQDGTDITRMTSTYSTSDCSGPISSESNVTLPMDCGTFSANSSSFTSCGTVSGNGGGGGGGGNTAASLTASSAILAIAAVT